jgi:voltage-gated potassium channel
VIILAATPEQLAAYDREYELPSTEDRPIVIIGGGRVGRAVGRVCRESGLSHCIVEQLSDRVRPGTNYVIGDAAERAVLEEAGIDHASAVVITTHDDDVNVYLTLYCRRLRPDIRVVARSKLERNVSTLYRAGADAVLSYAGTCSAAIWNAFRGQETLLIAEGLSVFRVTVPVQLAGKTLADAHIYRDTKCNVVAIERDGETEGNPDPHRPLPPDAMLVLIGTDEAEAAFAGTYTGRRPRAGAR